LKEKYGEDAFSKVEYEVLSKQLHLDKK